MEQLDQGNIWPIVVDIYCFGFQRWVIWPVETSCMFLRYFM